jgi:hypothetical protein
MEEALGLIPAETKLKIVAGAGHELKKGGFDLFSLVDGM